MVNTIFLGEAWGEQEEKIKRSMVGPTGIELFKQLSEAGFLELTSEDDNFFRQFWQTRDPKFVDMVWNLHPEIHRTNVFNRRPRYNRLDDFCGGKAEAIKGYPLVKTGKYIRSEFQPELDRLSEELCSINPNLIVALGNTAMWALLGRTAISKFRGATDLSTHTVSGFKVLPTYHPSAILHQWELRPVAIMDLNKAARECAFPEIRRPKRSIWIEPTLPDLELFYESYIKPNGQACEILSTDIETSGTRITCIGFAPSKSVAIVIPFTDPRRKGRSYWPTAQDERAAWLFIKRVLEDRSIRKLFQNGLYDVAFIWRSTGIKVYGAEEDTMLLQHSLQPESLKGLGFLGSIYSSEMAWKQLRTRSETIKKDD